MAGGRYRWTPQDQDRGRRLLQCLVRQRPLRHCARHSCFALLGLTVGAGVWYYNTTRQEGRPMPFDSIIWDLDDDPDGNVQHCAEHGVTKE